AEVDAARPTRTVVVIVLAAFGVRLLHRAAGGAAAAHGRIAVGFHVYAGAVAGWDLQRQRTVFGRRVEVAGGPRGPVQLHRDRTVRRPELHIAGIARE